MAMLTTSDVCAIHTAIHSKPTAGWVTTASFGMLPLVKNSYGNGSVDLPGGLGACVGGNPKKDSKFGRKMRAGSAITLINPLGTHGYESRCLVIESLTPTSPPTVFSGMHFALPNLLTDVGLGKTNDLNVGDPSRMRDDDGLKAAEAISADAPSFAKRSKRGTIDMVEVDKRGTAKCKECHTSFGKGSLRFGFRVNYRGHVSNAWLHLSCAAAHGRTAPTADELPTLDGWASLSEEAKQEAKVATGGQPAALTVD